MQMGIEQYIQCASDGCGEPGCGGPGNGGCGH